MKSTAVKDKIIETATRLFYEQGYNLTGINQVIDEAGIARGSLYYNFESKTALLLTYLSKCHDMWFIETEAFLSPLQSSREKILGLFDFKIIYQERFNFGGCPFIKITNEIGKQNKDVTELVQQCKLEIRNYISDLVKDAPLKGMLAKDELADMIFFLLEGGDISSSIFNSNDQILKARNIIEKLL